MTISVIVAMGKRRQIGLNNKLPWKLKDDLENFKKLTSENVVIFGRKTFESIGKPLPNRINVVITRQKNYTVNGAIVFNSLNKAIENFKDKHIFICGGQEIYNEIFKRNYKIDNLFITFVDYDGTADTFFPEINFDKWKVVKTEKYYKNEYNDFNYVIKTFQPNII